MRESEFSRGYFVGGLGLGRDDVDDRMDGGGKTRKKRVQQILDDDDDGGEEMGDGDDLEASGGGGRYNIERTMNPVDESELSSSSSLPAACKGLQGQGEWVGDRIEILVGSGDVYLQYEDENEEDHPFCRNTNTKKDGFWKRVFTYPQVFFS